MRKPRIILLLGVFLTLSVLLIAAGTIASRLYPQAGTTMNQAHASTNAHLQKPPIDLAAPAKTETATFALG
jgi:anionic cell wall polymer biosynthesis LytR-Cps2A-Psr (LCP) family protein